MSLPAGWACSRSTYGWQCAFLIAAAPAIGFAAMRLVPVAQRGVTAALGLGQRIAAHPATLHAIEFAEGVLVPGPTSGIASSTAMMGTKAMGQAVSDATVVCRGGSCTAQAFANGKGVTTNPANGQLDGVSTGLGNTIASASLNIPHSKVGVTTAGDIRAAGGQVINDRGNHGTVSGLTADKAAEVFKRVVENPNR